MTDESRMPCPCCRSPVLRERGAYEVCPVCGWEDDPAQVADRDFRGGANRESLNAARQIWRARRRD
jgi:uncharacterized Zn finger protein (UPF0148 family)